MPLAGAVSGAIMHDVVSAVVEGKVARLDLAGLAGLEPVSDRFLSKR